ncbi:WbqC family protein [Variovorax ginsengisoli]|uniref:WbqC family protein n=1 Tax=Variovorax ginsengisoli TaxID=363844 RepID=A0ABT8SA98_9BURK|nr:WbqC family protein [Variovorax ginsengisoli]MDN8616669.1 WbqC family protein [Variovorax ginsengisoli]MDO1535839.1 WbqC family protein [Variovorax ginsengisoli]
MQPYFLPYLGYFQLMSKVDAFVLYDDVNFINRGWINRNRIDIDGAAHMLTVPLRQASQNRRICDIALGNDTAWRGRIVKSIRQAYARASQFERVFPLIERVVQHPAENLADYLLHSLNCLRDHLGLKTEIIATSRQYGNADLRAQARIIDICLREKADLYVNSIGGIELYDRARFEENGLRLEFLTPSLQPHAHGGAGFMPGLSMVDVLMHNDAASIDAQLQGGVLS